MKNSRKQKLIGLGAEVLVESLLELAVLSDAADDLVERLIATPRKCPEVQGKNIRFEAIKSFY